MASKYHKNAVLTGSVDCYCLACDSHLRCQEDVGSHIEKPIHKKNLESTNYLDKYKEDHVRKVKKGYYCEFCNVLLQTAAKVSLHIAEPNHNNNKGIQRLKRLGNSIISADYVLINENAWNGFIDETCAICNTEFYSDNLHKTEHKHILNLIQKNIDFGLDKTIYRIIDESSFQCLTCNMIFCLSTIATHSKSEDHKKHYTKCREFKPPVNLFNDYDPHKENNSENVQNKKPETSIKSRNESPPKSQKSKTDEEKHNKVRMAKDVMCAKMKNESKANKNDDTKPVDVAKTDTENKTKIFPENTTKPCLKNVPKSFNDDKKFAKKVFPPKDSSSDSDNITENEKELHDNARMVLNAMCNSHVFELRAKKNLHKNPALAKTDTEQKLDVNSITAEISKTEEKNVNTAEGNEPKANNDKHPDHLAKSEADKIPVNDKYTNNANENTSEYCLLEDSNEITAKNSKTEDEVNPVKKEVKKKKGKCVVAKGKKFFANPSDQIAKTKNTCNTAKTSKNATEGKIEINDEIKTTDTKIEVNQVSVNIQNDLIQDPEEPRKQTGLQDKVNPKTKKQESSTQYDDRAKVLDNVLDYQKNGISINFEIGTAFCKKCFRNIKVNCKSIEDHIELHKNESDINTLLFTQVLNVNHNKTVLKEVQTNETYKNVDQNHNITSNVDQKPTTVTNEGNYDTNGDNKALVKYVPNNPIEVTTQPDVPKINPKDPESFAKANKLTYNKGNKNAFCRLCSVRIPASLRCMQEHINGMSHKRKAAKVANFKPIIPKKLMKMFVKQKIEICNRYIHDVIINDRLCLSKLSYMMITDNEVTLRCQACEVNLSKSDVTRHLESYFHERAMDSTPVVWNLDTEFVREVRPGIFHCGFCNQVVGCWEDVSTHLKCEEHEDNKVDASCRLQDHMPDVLEHREQRQMEFMRMFMNYF